MAPNRILFGLALAVAAGAVAAQGTARIDQRQANQKARIERGVATGELTPAEQARLEAGQKKVERLENKAGADGVYTGKERARIEHAQDVQSRKVFRQKHDRQKR